MDEREQLAIINARVWTGTPRRPWADAVLVRGDRIELVGSSAEVRKASTPACRRIDARGMLVAPLWRSPRPERDDDALVRAVRSSARGAAQTELGALHVGARADLAMFDRDVTRATSDELGVARVVLLMRSGRVILDGADLA
jgi:predicted amidohydrolase YtcJ